MKYMGSKARFVKEILPIILKDRKENQWFVDLFCVGCSIAQEVDGKVIANDKNKYLIAMFKGLQENRNRPTEITKDLYNVARDVYNGKEKVFNHTMEMDDFMVGWIGWMGSYNGRFFDGGYSGHNVNGRDYISEQIRNTEKQIDKIKHIKFFSRDYSMFDFKEPCIIYCDIPYENTKQYSTSKGFNHNDFWEWCRGMTKDGHKVFISEYNAPSDFTCIWSKETTNSMNTTKTYKPTEKLFQYCL